MTTVRIKRGRRAGQFGRITYSGSGGDFVRFSDGEEVLYDGSPADFDIIDPEKVLTDIVSVFNDEEINATELRIAVYEILESNGLI